MHSTIFQVSNEPIRQEDWVNEDTVVEYSNTDCGIDYVVALTDDAEKKYQVARLAMQLGDMVTINPDGLSLTYNGGMDIWKRQFYKRIENIIATYKPQSLTLSSFHVKQEIVHPIGMDLFIMDGNWNADDSGEFMSWLEDLNVGDVIYFGVIMDYHF